MKKIKLKIRTLRISFIISVILLLSVPAISAAVPLSSNPGDVFKIIVPDNQEIQGISASFLGRQIEFFKTGEKWRGLFPSMPEQKSGSYPITLEIRKSNGVCEKIHKQAKLVWKKFPAVYFTLPPSRKKLMAGSTVNDEWSEIEKILLKKNPSQLWLGRFIMPVPGIVTMSFGEREFVNKKRRGCHRGADFRAAVGTPVRAVNSGEVVFTGQLRAFGGTMIIDHGQGVHSLYFHLSKFLVPSGTVVSKGEYVAKTGNSGISSGPHLHWGLSVNNVRVNPIQWTKQIM